MEVNTTDTLKAICDALRPILQLELALGNEIEAVLVDGWTQTPFAVSLKRPLHLEEIRTKLGAPSADVKLWTNTDTHYPLETGFVCEKTRHSLAGPAARS
jgi:hypothetical protein